jgi:hypothetical protein
VVRAAWHPTPNSRVSIEVDGRGSAMAVKVELSGRTNPSAATEAAAFMGRVAAMARKIECLGCAA